MIPKSIKTLLGNCLEFEPKVKVLNEIEMITKMDSLVNLAVYGDTDEKVAARWVIWELAQETKNYPSSIHNLYIARGRGGLPLDFTVPAINVRGMAYDTAQVIFSVAQSHNAGALLFELARSEMEYTGQSPSEYSAVILGAAIKSGWNRPVFIQGDHFQTKKDLPGVPKVGEVEVIKNLMLEAMNYGFYNIDIDTSTLVDLEQPTEELQQKPNIEYSLEFAKFIRANEPTGVTVSLGGEIGHIGGKNSTVEDFDAYVSGFNDGLNGLTGMSKISIQTGTSHGGVVLPDGTLADINVDFSVLLAISRECRKFGMGGAVQHGASTLPDAFFNQFTKSEAVEVHLATGFQNIIMDHPSFPQVLLQEMYAWLDETKAAEKKEGQTDEQFHYKLRKKSWGEFKRKTWEIDSTAKRKIMQSLKERFEFLFDQLNIKNTSDYVAKTVKPVEIRKSIEDFTLETVTNKVVLGLSD